MTYTIFEVILTFVSLFQPENNQEVPIEQTISKNVLFADNWSTLEGNRQGAF
jgi:hypothetical protein